MYDLSNASPADLATILSAIKKIGKDKNWIRPTQMTHIDLMLAQLYRVQARLIAEESNGTN